MLATTTAGTLVAEKTHTFTAYMTDSIETVLGKLCVHDLLSLPVVDSSNKLMGMVSILDLLIFLSWAPYFQTGQIDESTTELRNLNRPISQLLGLTTEGRSLWIVEPTMPLKSLIEPFSRDVHRVLVPQKDDEGKNAYRVLSQSDVVNYIYKNRHEVADKMSKTLSELGIQPKPVVSITSSTTALEGFKTMSLEKVTALAITDNGKLVGNLSASDLRGLTRRRLHKVVTPVKHFLETMHGNVRDPLTTTLDSTLDQALSLIVTEGVHRLWIVDAQKEVIGILSLTDIIKLFV